MGNCSNGLVAFLELRRWVGEVSYFSSSSWCMDWKSGGIWNVVKCWEIGTENGDVVKFNPINFFFLKWHLRGGRPAGDICRWLNSCTINLAKTLLMMLCSERILHIRSSLVEKFLDNCLSSGKDVENYTLIWFRSPIVISQIHKLQREVRIWKLDFVVDKIFCFAWKMKISNKFSIEATTH